MHPVRMGLLATVIAAIAPASALANPESGAVYVCEGGKELVIDFVTGDTEDRIAHFTYDGEYFSIWEKYESEPRDPSEGVYYKMGEYEFWDFGDTVALSTDRIPKVTCALSK